MSIKEETKGAELIVESDVGPESSEFRPQQTKSIIEAVDTITTSTIGNENSHGWLIARKKVELFKPIPWFLWRLALSVFSKPVGTEEINEGMVLGLRRLLFAAASDPVLGTGSKVNSVKKALEILPADLIAAVGIMHSVCRRLRTYKHESIWRPILDEALVQAQIGYEIGKVALEIGKGRGLLAGFAGPIGLAILVACGDKKQAAETIERMSSGETNSVIGQNVYGCEPIQVSSMLLAAAGCGPDAANGLAVSSLKHTEIIDLNKSRAIWAAGAYIVEALRRNKGLQISEDIFEILGIPVTESEALQKRSNKLARSGHSWQWID